MSVFRVTFAPYVSQPSPASGEDGALVSEEAEVVMGGGGGRSLRTAAAADLE